MSPRENARSSFVQRLLETLRRQQLARAGERIAVAVSGGADSVALSRALLECRAELGIVISVAHFDHQIRGEQSRVDAEFVRSLAQQHDLEFHFASGDARARAAEKKETLEEAARELRQEFFRRLLASGAVDKVATAHTMNDQAETVLLRLIRGAGTRGLGGIRAERDQIIRPLLGSSRAEVEAYLRSLGQAWKEDASNADLSHARNRVRHQLLPTLVKDFNPNIVETLARSAEVAQAEEDYWRAETDRLLPFVVLPGKPVRGGGRAVSTEAGEASMALQLDALLKQPLALQRRLVRAAAERLAIRLDAFHVDTILELAISAIKGVELPDGWCVKRTFRELRFERASRIGSVSPYNYPLVLPGEAVVPELKGRVRATVSAGNGGYNSPQADALVLASSEVTIRNWRAGDRYHPAHARSEKKVKELLQPLKIPETERGLWPVVVQDERLLWVKDLRQRAIVLNGQAVTFEFVKDEED